MADTITIEASDRIQWWAKQFEDAIYRALWANLTPNPPDKHGEVYDVDKAAGMAMADIIAMHAVKKDH